MADFEKLYKESEKINDSLMKVLKERIKLEDRLNKAEKKRISLFGNTGTGDTFSKSNLKYELSRTSTFVTGPVNKAFQDWTKNLQIQANALAFGQSLKDLRAGKEKRFERGLGGFTQQLQSEVGLKDVGFRDVSKGMRNLSVAMRLTGQNEEKLHSTLREANLVGGLNNQEIKKLATNITNSSQLYGTKADSLVNAIDGLKESMLDFNALGIGSPMDNLAKELAAEYGEGSEQQISMILNELTRPVNAQTLILTNTLNDVNTLLSHQNLTGDAGLKIFDDIRRKITQSSQDTYRILQGDKSQLFWSKNTYEQLFGQGTTLANLMNSLDKLNKRTTKAADDQHTAEETWEAQWGEFYSKQSHFVSFLVPRVEQITRTLGDMLLTMQIIAGVETGSKFLGGLKTILQEGVQGSLLGNLAKRGATGGMANYAAAFGGAEGGGSLLATAGPWALGAAALIGLGYGAYRMSTSDDRKKKAMFEDLMERTAPSKTSLATSVSEFANPASTFNNNSGIENLLLNIADINKKSSDLQQDVVKELKKMNSSTISARGVNLSR